MAQSTPPGFLLTLWLSFIGFLGNLFKKSPTAPDLPNPVTTRSPQPTVRVTHPKRALTDPEHIFHPPPSPFPNISLSGIFATSPLLASPCIESHPLSPEPQSPFRGSHGPATPSFHTLHSRSPCTPRSPSSAVLVRLDRSIISPTTMSDGSLEVISLGDRRGFVGSPVKVADIPPLPSPWSPTGRMTSSDVWMSVDGMLVNATGPVDNNPAHSQDDSTALRTAMLSSLTMSRISAPSLYSSPSALDALGISVFVNLDGVGDHLSSQGNNVDTRDDPASVPKLNQVRDENRPTLVTQDPQTPNKRRETFPSITASHTPSQSSRATKCLSTPLTKLDNVDISHVRSTSSISSMTYELRLGLFADGKSMTAIENIISLLDQASPESIPPHNDSVQPVEAV